jgi:hypothetical protein
VVFKDTNRNGRADLILSHTNGFSIFSMNGTLMREWSISNPDTTCTSGSNMVAWNWANDDRVYYFGGFSRNRLLFFDSNFNIIESLSRTLSQPIRSLPFIAMDEGSVYIYLATDKGRMFNIQNPLAVDTGSLNWNLSGGNYFRNAFWQEEMTNSFPDNRSVFIKDETYVFPSPWLRRHHNDLKFSIMATVDTDVNIKIYNIAGQLVAEMTEWAEALVVSIDRFVFNPDRWSSGVYFAIVSAQGNSVRLKFAIER